MSGGDGVVETLSWMHSIRVAHDRMVHGGVRSRKLACPREAYSAQCMQLQKFILFKRHAQVASMPCLPCVRVRQPWCSCGDMDALLRHIAWLAWLRHSCGCSNFTRPLAVAPGLTRSRTPPVGALFAKTSGCELHRLDCRGALCAACSLSPRRLGTQGTVQPQQQPQQGRSSVIHTRRRY